MSASNASQRLGFALLGALLAAGLLLAACAVPQGPVRVGKPGEAAFRAPAAGVVGSRDDSR
ncbi:hypothetical protein ACFXA3_40005 [Streptomyces sp. NPDC059456]|uniref:hypothetical protein n=1 Tax=Streptomyces sp. NPDC059456 TaxID=3346838 RepID=UPI0036AE8C4B